MCHASRVRSARLVWNLDVRHDLMRAFFISLDAAHDAGLATWNCRNSRPRRTSFWDARDFSAENVRVEVELDLRYVGQQWTIRTPIGANDTASAIRALFEQIHEARYRHIQPDGAIEITAIHTIAYGLVDKVELATQGLSSEQPRPIRVTLNLCGRASRLAGRRHICRRNITRRNADYRPGYRRGADHNGVHRARRPTHR